MQSTYYGAVCGYSWCVGPLGIMVKQGNIQTISEGFFILTSLYQEFPTSE